METSETSALGALFDRTKTRLGLTSDYQLAKRLGWHPPVIYAYRYSRRGMGLATMERFAALTGTSFEDVREAVRKDEKRVQNYKARQKSLPLNHAA